MPATARPAYTIHSRTFTSSEAWTKAASGWSRPHDALSASVIGASCPLSWGVRLTIWFTSLYRAVAWPCTAEVSVGRSHCNSRPPSPKICWTMSSSPGSAMTAPSHPEPPPARLSAGPERRGSAFQNEELRSAGSTIPVTSRRTVVSFPGCMMSSGAAMVSRDPGRNANTLAVCGVTTTWTSKISWALVTVGCGAVSGMRPATSRRLPAAGYR